MLAIRVEGHVPRTRPGGDVRERYFVRTERAGREIEIQRVDLVGAEVDAEYVRRIEVGKDLVRVRTFLAQWIGTRAVADTLKQIAHGSESAAGDDGKDGEVAGAVVGGHHIQTRGVDTHVRGEASVRRLRVDERERAVRRIERIRAHVAGVVLVDGIQVRERRAECE